MYALIRLLHQPLIELRLTGSFCPRPAAQFFRSLLVVSTRKVSASEKAPASNAPPPPPSSFAAESSRSQLDPSINGNQVSTPDLFSTITVAGMPMELSPSAVRYASINGQDRLADHPSLKRFFFRWTRPPSLRTPRSRTSSPTTPTSSPLTPLPAQTSTDSRPCPQISARRSSARPSLPSDVSPRSPSCALHV